MRKLVLSCLLLSVAIGTAHAQGVPEQVAFTARLQTNGQPASGLVDLTFRLYPTLTGGLSVWSEEHMDVLFSEGLGYVQLGSTDPLDAGVFDGSPRYVEIVVNGTTMSPRLAVGSVPYAVRAGVANTAESLGAFTPADFITGVSAGAGLTGGGSSGDVGLGVNFAGSGTATTVARSDHAHNYLPIGSALVCTGTDKVAAITAAGSVVCAPDQDTPTVYNFGAGLTVTGGTDVSVTYPAAGGDSGTSSQASRADHAHDARYFTESELSATGGTVNNPSNPVDWGRIKGMPGGFADGFDNGVGLSGGAGRAIISSLTVRARADCGTVAPAPRMEVYVNHSLVGGVDVTSASNGDFTFTLAAATYAHEVAVAFVNDNQNGPCDHNLYVDSITLGTATLRSDAIDSVIRDGGSSFFDGVDVSSSSDALTTNGALRFFLGPTSDAPAWVKVHEAVLQNASDYVISGLDGNRDRVYVVVLSGFFTTNLNRTIGLRPNGATTNYAGGAQHWFGHIPSVNYIHDRGSQGTLNLLPLCLSHFDTNGTILCKGEISAETGAARLVQSENVFAPVGGTIIMSTTSVNAWLDTSANITSMTLHFSGAGDFDGHLYVYRIR